MRFAEACRVALTALRVNRLRSALTMLGVIIGVFAVVLLVGIGTGAKVEVERQVQGLGSNLLLVFPGELTFGSAPTSSRLTLSDVDTVGRLVGGPDRVVATVTSGETLRAGRSEVFLTVQGTTEAVPDVFARRVGRGEFLRRSDVDTRRRVVVLGASAADRSAVTQEQILGVVGKIFGILTFVLAAIASISLLVGGVGITNIMLVSVRERTREIGLRKAVGARQRDILVQFLIEAVLLTTVGGVVGIGLGIAGAALIERFSPVPASIVWWSPLLAFGVSAGVGVFFGVAPARRAGRLDPVVALRAE